MVTSVPLSSLRHQEPGRSEWYSEGRRTTCVLSPSCLLLSTQFSEPVTPSQEYTLNSSRFFLLCHEAQMSRYANMGSPNGTAKESVWVSNVSVPHDLTTERRRRNEGRKEGRKQQKEFLPSPDTEYIESSEFQLL